MSSWSPSNGLRNLVSSVRRPLFGSALPSPSPVAYFAPTRNERRLIFNSHFTSAAPEQVPGSLCRRSQYGSAQHLAVVGCVTASCPSEPASAEQLTVSGWMSFQVRSSCETSRSRKRRWTSFVCLSMSSKVRRLSRISPEGVQRLGDIPILDPGADNRSCLASEQVIWERCISVYRTPVWVPSLSGSSSKMSTCSPSPQERPKCVSLILEVRRQEAHLILIVITLDRPSLESKTGETRPPSRSVSKPRRRSTSRVKSRTEEAEARTRRRTRV